MGEIPRAKTTRGEEWHRDRMGKVWQRLDAGESKIHAVVNTKGYIVHTSWVWDAEGVDYRAVLTLFDNTRFPGRDPGILRVEETIKEFPSEHLIAKLLLICGSKT